MKFHDVFDHQNGLDRIEEGVHGPWEQGAAQDIMDTLFLQSSPTLESWDHVRRLRVFDNGTAPANVQDVMMVTGDSTKMLVPHGDHGGVNVTRQSQKVSCHYDDIHNFTWVVYGTKTFVLAPQDAVEPGTGQHTNENRSVDTSGPLFRRAVVSQGQLLYLPKDWWHEVQTNPEGSMTVGQWFTPAASRS